MISLKKILTESINEGLYFVGYNKGRGQGTGVFKDSYSSYKDAKKAVEKLEKERGGSYNQIAYYVADKDGKFVRESVTEASMPPVRKVVNAILKKHGLVPMKTTSTSVRGFHNIQRGGYRYEGDLFLGFYGDITQNDIEKIGDEMKKAGVKDVDVRRGIISADFTKTGLKESVKEVITNPKKTNPSDLAKTVLGWFDFYTDYIDDGGQRRSAIKNNEDTLVWFGSHPKDVKEKAYKIMLSQAKSEKGQIEKTFGKHLKEINEAKAPYEVYHKSYTSAIEAAREYAEKKGFEIDNDDAFTKIGVGPRKPSEGKTNSFSIQLSKDGKPQRKQLHIQIYGMKNSYELNAYIG